MSLKLKELNEQRGAKLKQARALFDKAQTEKRDLNADEQKQLDGLHKEIEELDSNISLHIRQLALEGSKAPKLSGNEERDVDSFDYGKLMRHLVNGEALDGIEAEMTQEGMREARAAGVPIGRNVMLPRMLVQRRDLTATGGTSLNQGGNTIVTDKMGILDAFYNALALREAGATVLTGLQGNFDWPRWIKPSNPTHKAENVQGDKLDPTLDVTSFSPKRLPAYVLVSDQLVIQSSDAIRTVLERNLNAQVGSLVEYYAIAGAGGSQPLGILGTTGIGAVIGGTNGAAPDWADIVALEAKVDLQNALQGQIAYVSNSKVKGQLKTTPKVSGTDSLMILDDRAGGLLNSHRNLWTNNVPYNLTKGTASGICSAILFGNWADLVLAFWSGISLEYVRDIDSATKGRGAVVLNLYSDSGVIRPESFSAMKDALTPNVQ